jgi:hypothetical protein
MTTAVVFSPDVVFYDDGGRVLVSIHGIVFNRGFGRALLVAFCGDDVDRLLPSRCVLRRR